MTYKDPEIHTKADKKMVLDFFQYIYYFTKCKTLSTF